MKKLLMIAAVMFSSASYADYTVNNFSPHIAEYNKSFEEMNLGMVGVLMGFVQGTVSHITSDVFDEEYRVCRDALYESSPEENLTTFVKFAEERQDEWDKDMKQMVWLSMLYEYGEADDCTK